ncbi:hypothetical protein GWK47_052968 [Chionoecetes opilio]|uniref:Uncharacterized protein n=1 Tax=Chionoecetes opilio TaxID=41210 RepID=A0A8J4Y0Y2_CHIOP|nr:hypothetical protein GWK47_052968 [Chionoecetes opilio]
MQVSPKIDMEKWKGDVLDINETVWGLGLRKCSNFSVSALSGCDTVSYPFVKGKLSAFKLLEIDMPGLDQVLGQPSVTHAQLPETACTFFLPLYGQKSCTTMNDTRAHLYRCRKKPPPLKKLPPTDANLQLHVLRAHLQMLLGEGSGQCDPLLEARNIANFGWNIEGVHHHTGRLNSASCSPSTPGCS